MLKKHVKYKSQFILLIISLLFFSRSFSQKLISKEDLLKYNYEEVIGATEEGMPKLDSYAMYPNGIDGIREHIQKTLIYPEYSYNNDIEGDVIVEFTVNKKGSIKKVKVIQGVSEDIDKEAKRVILSLQQFYPGFINKKPVKLSYAQAIRFKFE